MRRSAPFVAAFSILAFLLQGFAEQGGIGSELSPVPNQPLPFARDKIFGLDLTDRPSLEAVEWLEEAGSGSFALTVVRVDADIVAALRASDQSPDAFRALDQLMSVTRDTNVALCLERPVVEIDDDVLAELTIDALRDRYPDRIAYVTSCRSSPEPGWMSAIGSQLRSSAPATPERLIPLSTGAVVEVRPGASFEDLQSSKLRSFAGNRYVLPIIQIAAPISVSQKQLAVDAIMDAAQIALILLQPVAAEDSPEMMRSFTTTELPGGELPEGYSSVDAQSVILDDRWESSTIGRVSYQRSISTGASLRASFSGTTVYLQALLSPDSGTISVWIDPDPAQPGPPDREIDLDSQQARDDAIVLAEGLDAERHVIALVSSEPNITIAGLFVSGQPAAGWTAGLSALALIGTAAVALSIVGLGRVQAIRDRNSLPPGRTSESGHPRAYRRDV